jgi:hypothetical protein
MHEARGYKSQALATSTKASYKTHHLTFLRFSIFYDLEPVPAAQFTIACYVAHLARTMSPVSVSIYMNIIRILHKEAGLVNPLSDNYEVTIIKRGLLRVKGAPPNQKDPMTPAILVRIYHTLDLSTNGDKAFWCAVLVGFFGFLRKASLFPHSPRVPPQKRLCKRDVSQLSLEGFVLTCNHSKTNQCNQRVHTIPYSYCYDRRLAQCSRCWPTWGQTRSTRSLHYSTLVTTRLNAFSPTRPSWPSLNAEFSNAVSTRIGLAAIASAEAARRCPSQRVFLQNK